MLPCCLLGPPDPRAWHAVVPNISGEDLWIAFWIPPGTRIHGARSDGMPAVIVPLGGLYEGFDLVAARSLGVAPDLTTIGEHSLAPSDHQDAVRDNHIAFSLELPKADGACLHVALATARWWKELSGLQAPSASKARDAYGGERLP